MSIRQAPTGDFDTDLTQLLPRLRIYALSLTRDSVRADDLVQQTVLRSLAGRNSFRPGTNFPGWLFRIQRNEFISGLRRERPTVELNDAISSTLSHAAAPGERHRHARIQEGLPHPGERATPCAAADRARRPFPREDRRHVGHLGRHGEEQGLARPRPVEGNARPRDRRLHCCRATAARSATQRRSPDRGFGCLPKGPFAVSGCRGRSRRGHMSGSRHSCPNCGRALVDWPRHRCRAGARVSDGRCRRIARRSSPTSAKAVVTASIAR